MNECLDESPMNNEFQCVSCNKLITKFDLTHDMLESLSQKKENSLSFESLFVVKSTLKLKHSILNVYLSSNTKQIFKCSKESALFGSFIVKSLHQHTKDRRNLLETNRDHNKAREEIKLNDYFGKNNIYSSITPYGFDIEFLYLPYEELPNIELGGVYNYERFLILIVLIIACLSIMIFCCRSDFSSK